MKKVLLTVFAGALAGLMIAPALAAPVAEITTNGLVRARVLYQDNYIDQTDHTASGDINDDSGAFTAYRLVFGLTAVFEHDVTARVDVQYNGHFGDEGSPAFAFFGSPYQTEFNGVVIHQGWVEAGKIGGSDIGVRVGRGEHTYGTELFLGDNDHYNGLTFDGGRGMWKHGASDLNIFYYKIAEDNNPFTSGAGNSPSDASLFGGTYDYNFNGWGTAGAYALYNQDLDDQMKVNTYGLRWNRGMMTGDKLNRLDWNIEFAVQNGDSGNTFEPDISASVIEGWFGYNFNAGANSHGRVHVGTLMTSGDETANLMDNGDFNSPYGDFHAYNRFGDMDWVDSATLPALGGVHNLTDYNIGYEHWFGANHSFMLAYHIFQLTEANGLAEDKIADEVDVKYRYRYSKNVALEAMIGQANPNDDFVPFGPPADSVRRGSFEVQLSW